MLHALQNTEIPSRFPNPASRDAVMGRLHLQGGWSFRELGRAFGCDHKTVQGHLAPLDAFFSGISIPELLKSGRPP
jgi:hypothetical protein